MGRPGMLSAPRGAAGRDAGSARTGWTCVRAPPDGVRTPMRCCARMSAFDGRYAPSPSGTLHVGNLRTALLAWCFARSRGAPLPGARRGSRSAALAPRARRVGAGRSHAHRHRLGRRAVAPERAPGAPPRRVRAAARGRGPLPMLVHPRRDPPRLAGPARRPGRLPGHLPRRGGARARASRRSDRLAP